MIERGFLQKKGHIKGRTLQNSLYHLSPSDRLTGSLFEGAGGEAG